MLKIVYGSLIATFLTIVIGAMYPFFVPQYYDEQVHVTLENKTYTWEELKQAESEAWDRANAHASKRLSAGYKATYKQGREDALWLSFWPWLFWGFVINSKKLGGFIVAIIPLTGVAVFNLILPMEFSICILVFSGVFFLRKYFYKSISD